MITLDIATAPHKDSKHWKQGKIDWSELAEWVEHPATEKVCGSYVLGVLREGRRTRATVTSRCAVTLDADYDVNSDLPYAIELVYGWAAIIHTTFRSSPEALRLRLIFLLSRAVTADEYRAIVQALMTKLGAKQFDPGSAEPERYMFKPSAQRPDWFQSWVIDGEPLDADALLAESSTSCEGEGQKPPSAPSPDLATPPTANEVEKAQAVLEKAVRAVELSEGGRNNTVSRNLLPLYSFIKGGCLDRDDVDERLWDAAQSAPGNHEYARDEFDASRRSAWRKAQVERPRVDSPEIDFGPLIDGDRSTWAGMDLGRYLDGSHKPPVAKLLTRLDGVSLLYPGLTHSLHGEPESGKSFVMQHLCALLMTADEHVLYLDFESDPASIVERLLELGVSSEVIAERFTYLQPATDPDRSQGDLAALLSTLGAHPYALVVIDGVSESMEILASASKDPNENAIEWARKLPRRIADRTGAAVVQIDHVTKNPDTRGRFAIGGQAKLSALTGAGYSIDVKEPLGRGLRGVLSLRVVKDRPGYVRGKSGEARASDRTQEAARVVVDSTGDGLVVTVEPPVLATDHGDSGWRPTALMEQVSLYLEEADSPRSGNRITSEVKGKRTTILEAIKALVVDGYVVASDGPRGAVHHASVKSYREAYDEFLRGTGGAL